MKKIILAVLVLLMGTTLLAGCSKEKVDALTQVQNKGVLVLGTSADYPPYEFHMEIDGVDTIVGFDIEIAKKIAADIGVSLEIIDMKFEGLLPALTAGKIDLIVAGMNPTEERKQSVDFSDVYYDPAQAMLIRTDDLQTLSTIAHFSGKAVGVQKGTIQEEIAKESFENSNTTALDKIPNMIMSLKTGKVDGILLAEPVAKSYAKVNADLSIVDLGLGSEGGVAIAVKKDSDTLLKAINTSLKELIETGELDVLITEATLLSEGE